MIGTAARRWPLAVAALAAVAGIIAAVVVATTDSSQPAPQFTLNSTTHPIADGALTGDDSCTTISRSTSGDPAVVVHAHLLSTCKMPLRVDLSGDSPVHHSQPTPEFTLNSTTHPIADGALTGNGACTTISRSTSGEPGVVVHAHLLSACKMPLRVDLSGNSPAHQLWIGESEAAPARPQSMSPGSFRDVATVVIRRLPGLPTQSSYRELREAFERIPLVELRDVRLPTLIVPAESFRLYFQ